MRKYFFSYFFKTKTGKTGHGHMTIEHAGLIRGGEELQAVCKFICKRNRFKEIAILNWRRYEEPFALIGGGR